MLANGWSSINVVNLLFGLVVLLMGRKLYWLVVGFIGFIVGSHYATYVWQLQPPWLLIGIAALAGIVGAVLAVFFQKIAVWLAGFVAGGYVALHLAGLLGVVAGQLKWLPFLIGGIVGMLLLYLIFDWALIVISALIGASVIIQTLNLTPGMEFGLFLALVILGLAIQAVAYQKSAPPSQNKEGMP